MWLALSKFAADKDIESDSETDGKSDDTDSDDNESEKENRDPNVEWNITGRNREPFEFSVNDGQQEIVSSRFRYKCLFYMEKYLDNDLISIIVDQTNLYTDQCLQSHPNLSRDQGWENGIQQPIMKSDVLSRCWFCKISLKSQHCSCIFRKENVLIHHSLAKLCL